LSNCTILVAVRLRFDDNDRLYNIHAEPNPSYAIVIKMSEILSMEQIDHEEYVKTIESLGAVWPTHAQLERINEFIVRLEGMGIEVLVFYPLAWKGHAMWKINLKFLDNKMQNANGERANVREAMIAACERLLIWIQKNWDGDYLVKSPNEEIMKQVVEMARVLRIE